MCLRYIYIFSTFVSAHVYVFLRYDLHLYVVCTVHEYMIVQQLADPKLSLVLAREEKMKLWDLKNDEYFK